MFFLSFLWWAESTNRLSTGNSKSILKISQTVQRTKFRVSVAHAICIFVKATQINICWYHFWSSHKCNELIDVCLLWWWKTWMHLHVKSIDSSWMLKRNWIISIIGKSGLKLAFKLSNFVSLSVHRDRSAL